MSGAAVALYIDPPSHHFLRDRLFDSDMAALGGDDLLAPYRDLRTQLASAGVQVHTADFLPGAPRGQANVYVSLGTVRGTRERAERPKTIASAFFAMECPIVEPSLYRSLPEMQRRFRRVFSWTDEVSLRPFVGEPLSLNRFHWPQSFDRVHAALWSRTDRQFLVMINANKLPRLYWQELYTKRLEAVAFFHQFGEIDLYGPNWSRMPNRVGQTWIPATARRLYRVGWEAYHRLRPHPLYAAASAASRGPAISKSQTLSRYRFAICFENMRMRGWITEKIFDCLFAGTVPVYWGAPDITEWVPSEAFIDMRHFPSFVELRAHLHSLTAPEIERLREAGRAFVESDRFAPFHRNTFVDHFRRILREDAGIDT